MAKKKLKDREGKDILLKWPTVTAKLWGVPTQGVNWIQAQPKAKGSRATHPRLNSAGAKLFSTQPDGMWIYTEDGTFVDVICVEVCGSITNLNDKRSRYAPMGHGLVVNFPAKWWNATIATQGGPKKPRWEACGAFAAAPLHDWDSPVRHLRTLFSIPDADIDTWRENNTPGGHEYFTRHSSLNSYTGQGFQKFLRGMSPSSHWYPQ